MIQGVTVGRDRHLSVTITPGDNRVRKNDEEFMSNVIEHSGSSPCYVAVPGDAARFDSEEIAIRECDKWNSPIHSIRHVVQCGPSEWSFLGHINCEHCEFCDAESWNPETRHCISVVRAT